MNVKRLKMESKSDLNVNKIKKKYNQLVAEKNEVINSEISKFRQSAEKLAKNTKERLDALNCTFPSTCVSQQEPRVNDEFLTIVDKKGNKTKEPLIFKQLEHVERLPRMQAYLPIQRNMLVEKQSILDSMPYLGEKDNDELVKELEKGQLKKEPDAKMTLIDEMVFKELVEYGMENRDQAVEEIEVYKDIADTLQIKASPKKLRQKFENMKKKEQKSQVLPMIDSVNATEKSHDYELTAKNFKSKFCRRCFIYNCDRHNEPSKPKKDPHKFYESTITTEKCGEMCYKNKDSGTTVDDVWNNSDASLFKVLRNAFLNDYCAIARAMQTKSCKQVKDFAAKLTTETSGKAVNSNATQEDTTQDIDLFEKVPISKPQKLRPNDAYKVYRKMETKKNGEVVSSYVPCDHEGSCEKDGCSCFVASRVCEKFCNCSSALCQRRFQGCKCKSQCNSHLCICKSMSRECDPDICECDTLPCNENKACQNFQIQRGMKKHLLLGKSDVAGWGVFAKDVIKKDEFISEYCGEVIPEKEAEHRAKVYDNLKCNYIFHLTKDHSIDATRKGNKIRFSNHSKNPNCYARQVFANGDYHIAYYAKREIKAGEELLVDYGESYSIHFKTLKKNKKEPNNK